MLYSCIDSVIAFRDIPHFERQKVSSEKSQHICEDHLFTFAVIADTHVTEAEATVIGGYDVDTVELGAARSAYVVRELNRLAPDFVVHLGDITHPEPGTPAYEDSAERFHTVYEALECLTGPTLVIPE